MTPPYHTKHFHTHSMLTSSKTITMFHLFFLIYITTTLPTLMYKRIFFSGARQSPAQFHLYAWHPITAQAVAVRAGPSYSCGRLTTHTWSFEPDTNSEHEVLPAPSPYPLQSLNSLHVIFFAIYAIISRGISDSTSTHFHTEF